MNSAKSFINRIKAVRTLLQSGPYILKGEPVITPSEESLLGLRVIWKLYEAERDGVLHDLTGLALDDDWKAVPLTEHGVWEEWENV